MTPLFPRIKSKKSPTPLEIQKDLVDFHEQNPAITEKTYGSCRTKEGKTGYEILLEAIDDFENKTIVDLACGNGPLIELITKKHPEIKKAVGVDLCVKDLELAKNRLMNDRVTFLCEPANKISLRDSSVDIFLCNMALMLFRPVEPVIQEICRILRPCGMFAAVLPNFKEASPFFVQIISILKSYISKENPQLEHFSWGDEKVLNEQGLASLFSCVPDFVSTITKTPFTVFLSEKHDLLAEKLLGFFYSSDFLSQERKYKIIKEWSAIFKTQRDKRGFISFPFPLTRISVQKKKY